VKITRKGLQVRLKRLREEIDHTQGQLDISDENFEKLNYFLTSAINCLDDALTYTED
jgi:hypothetical protein